MHPIVITRGAGNYKLVDRYIPGCAEVLLFRQRDEAGGRWTASLQKGVTTARVLETPPGIKDWNDWQRAGLTSDILRAAIAEAVEESPQSKLLPPASGSAKPDITLPSQSMQIIDCADALFPLLANGKRFSAGMAGFWK